jgi:hypothetical protein
VPHTQYSTSNFHTHVKSVNVQASIYASDKDNAPFILINFHKQSVDSVKRPRFVTSRVNIAS